MYRLLISVIYRVVCHLLLGVNKVTVVRECIELQDTAMCRNSTSSTANTCNYYSWLWGTIWGTFPSKKLLRHILFSDFCLVPSHSLTRTTMTVSFVALACALWASNLDGSQFGGVVWRFFSTLTMHDYRRYCNYDSWYLWILLAQYAQLHSVLLSADEARYDVRYLQWDHVEVAASSKRCLQETPCGHPTSVVSAAALKRMDDPRSY